MEHFNYVLDRETKTLIVLSYHGMISLTNLMPRLAPLMEDREGAEIHFVHYIDSEGDRTGYDVKKDKYFPL